jgi:RNA polymerase sigma-70 factor (ECF subfamily)
MFKNTVFRRHRPRGCPRSLFLPRYLRVYFVGPRAERWVAEFQAGSEEAFNELYSRYHGPMIKFVGQRIRDEEQCQELVQEIFIKVHRNRGSFDPRYAFSTWLWTIARNTVFDHLRRVRSEAEQAAAGDGGPLPLPEELPCPAPCAETLLHAKSERRRLMKVLKPLTRAQKRVLWLRIVHQRSFQEIAKHLDLSLASVKNLAYRAKAALADETGGALVLS